MDTEKVVEEHKGQDVEPDARTATEAPSEGESGSGDTADSTSSCAAPGDRNAQVEPVVVVDLASQSVIQLRESSDTHETSQKHSTIDVELDHTPVGVGVDSRHSQPHVSSSMLRGEQPTTISASNTNTNSQAHISGLISCDEQPTTNTTSSINTNANNNTTDPSLPSPTPPPHPSPPISAPPLSKLTMPPLADLSDLILHSPSSQIVGTPFATNSTRFEYPFPDASTTTPSSSGGSVSGSPPPLLSGPPLRSPSLFAGSGTSITLASSSTLASRSSFPPISTTTSSPSTAHLMLTYPAHLPGELLPMPLPLPLALPLLPSSSVSTLPTLSHPKLKAPVNPPVPPSLAKKRTRWSLGLGLGLGLVGVGRRKSEDVVGSTVTTTGGPGGIGQEQLVVGSPLGTPREERVVGEELSVFGYCSSTARFLILLYLSSGLNVCFSRSLLTFTSSDHGL
ncbi:hypothetical protein BDZ97DRAFT_1760979 [Flammula alnicola]|nr:hypothetical protein BDZ97DRAFT_1760979 [Flammula alnicola]